MKKNSHLKQTISLLILIFTFSISTIAQQNTVSAGGDASSSAGSISYSIGQVQYKTIESDSGIVTEGLQQPYEVFEIVAIDEVQGPDMSVYPNPVTDILFVEIPQFSGENVEYALTDMQGRILLQSEIRDSKTEIEMLSQAAGVYFLQMTIDGRKFKTFKIIKRK
ncbi:MAG: T9SS type A sorting domain-containing protein [Bacteroidales bacterium]|nr:T9SS type A sorting domain-containing protein [Bacteroidales bacterium]